MDLDDVKILLNRTQLKINKRWLKRRIDTSGSLNENRDLHGRFCANPFKQLDVYEGGKAYSCCSNWLPTSIGKISNTAIMDVWNSTASQKIRGSILDGSFKYCDHKVCPMIQNDSLPTLDEARLDPTNQQIIDQQTLILDEPPSYINLCNDASCNLYCPSCRRSKINYAKGRKFESRKHIQDLIKTQLFAEPSDRHFSINVTGSGDPFASAVFRDFLFNLNGADFPNLAIHLQTNGVLLTPRNWQRMHKIQNNIDTILVSLDAGTEETYNITRRGGNWTLLQENIKELGEFRKQGKLKHLRLDFVVQADNFREMEKFIHIGQSVGADFVAFSMVLDWGTWTPEQYRQKCVWKQNHPEFNNFIKILENPIFDAPIVLLGNISEYRSIARERLAN